MSSAGLAEYPTSSKVTVVMRTSPHQPTFALVFIVGRIPP
jgi:hypothetical protein